MYGRFSGFKYSRFILFSNCPLFFSMKSAVPSKMPDMGVPAAKDYMA